MVRSRALWIATFGAVAVACAAKAGNAQQPNPEAALKSHGLKRSGSTVVLAAEADTQKKVNEAQRLFRQLSSALAQQQQFEQDVDGQRTMVQGLREERILRNQQLRTINPQDVIQHNQLVARINELNDQLQLVEGKAADSRFKQDIDKEVARRREGFLQTILDLRQLVDKTSAEYAEIAQDDTIKQALAALASKSKSSALKLGPSREFQANVKLLEKAEKSVLTELVELRRKGGVYEVDVTFNGKVTVPLVFDTGASFTTISAELASRIDLRPQSSDRTVELHVADGGVIAAKLMTIPSMRVGKFTVDNVACAVMPPGKAEIPLLLGQSFHRHFTYKFTPESGQLVMSRIETMESRDKPARTQKKTTKAKRSSKAATGTNAPAAANDAGSPF
jgi:clan AA aspartic protease (TIGR02281 family)